MEPFTMDDQNTTTTTTSTTMTKTMTITPSEANGQLSHQEIIVMEHSLPIEKLPPSSSSYRNVPFSPVGGGSSFMEEDYDITTIRRYYGGPLIVRQRNNGKMSSMISSIKYFFHAKNDAGDYTKTMNYYCRLKNEAIICYKSEESVQPLLEIRFNAQSVASPWDTLENAFFFSHITISKQKHSDVTLSDEDGLILIAPSEADLKMWLFEIQRKINYFSALKFTMNEINDDSIMSPLPLDNISKFQRTSSYKKTYQYKYKELKTIGEGTFSIVKKVQHRQSGRMYAVKCSKTTPDLLEEVEILQSLNHPNILALHDFFESYPVSYMVLDYMEDGDLCDYLIKKKKFNEQEAQVLLRKIVCGLIYLHEQNIVHRDIKPENILLCGKSVKISDFGLAKKLEHRHDKLTNSCGTPEYAAPEILQGNEYGQECDVFSLGILIYIMLIGSFPFSIESAYALQNLKNLSSFNGKDIRNMTCLEINAPQWNGVSVEARDLILRMLDKDPVQRISMDKIIQHPWLIHEKLNNNDQEEEINQEIIRNQNEIYQGFLYCFKNNGIQVVKHGRKGTCHETLIRLNNNQIIWQSKNISMRSLIMESNVYGSSKNNNHELKKYIVLSDIQKITSGHVTPVFLKKNVKCLSNRCVSLITENRSLDLEFPNVERKEWFLCGIQKLVQTYTM